jgi:hypothetical protein
MTSARSWQFPWSNESSGGSEGASAESPSRSAELSERLAPAGRAYGVRGRLSLPDGSLILRSKMATLPRLFGVEELMGRFLCGRSSPRGLCHAAQECRAQRALSWEPRIIPDFRSITNLVEVPCKRSTLWARVIFATPLTGPRWGPPSESTNAHISPGEAAARPLQGCMTGSRRDPEDARDLMDALIQLHPGLFSSPSQG